MTRNLGIGQLRNEILGNLRGHQPLLDALDTAGLGSVNGPDDPATQIQSAQSLQETDYPVVLTVSLSRAGGGVTTSSSTSADVFVTIVVTARVNWRQAVDNEPGLGLSESYMDYILSLAGERANIAFAIDYLRANGLVGGAGADDLEDGKGGQWSVAGRWSVTRTVVGNDGPRA